jgi:hypothetical protein
MNGLGSRKNPLILRVHNAAKALTLMTLCHQQNWNAEIQINDSEEELLDDLDDILRRRPGWPVIKLKSNTKCPCLSGKSLLKCSFPD